MDTNEMVALLLPPNGCYKCSDTRKEIAEELARRAAAQPVAWATPSLLVTLSAVEKNHLTNPDRRTRGGEFESAARDAERYSVPLYAAPPAAPADDLDARLRAAVVDERLSTGALYREAADRIAALTAERDAVVRQMQTFNAVVQERDAKIVAATERAERAEAERDALRADAERYRWIRRSDTPSMEVIARKTDEYGVELYFGDELDAAIDAGRKG